MLTVGMLTCATKCAVQCSTHYLFMGNILLYVTMYCSVKLSLLFVYTIWIVRFSLDRLHFKKLNIPCDYVFSVVRDLARGKHVYIREKKKKKKKGPCLLSLRGSAYTHGLIYPYLSSLIGSDSNSFTFFSYNYMYEINNNNNKLITINHLSFVLKMLWT